MSLCCRIVVVVLVVVVLWVCNGMLTGESGIGGRVLTVDGSPSVVVVCGDVAMVVRVDHGPPWGFPEQPIPIPV